MVSALTDISRFPKFRTISACSDSLQIRIILACSDLLQNQESNSYRTTVVNFMEEHDTLSIEEWEEPVLEEM